MSSMMYYQVNGLRIKRKLSDTNLYDSHEIAKITGQRGYILAQVFNLNDTRMLPKKILRMKRLLQILKSQRTVSPFLSSTVLSKLENKKNYDVIVDRTQLTISVPSKR
jgi:hypothetical protein